MNIQRLKRELEEQGISIPVLARKMGVSKKLIYSRFNMVTSFTQKEISMIAKILNLENEKIMAIFFADRVS